MNLILIGYRGTGKSTVGLFIAQRLQRQFVDADEVLERKAGRTIRELFETEGEAYFRELEASVVAELLQQDQLVVSLGGGAILRDANRKLLRQANHCTVWLRASASTLYERILADPATAERRPNLTAGGGREEVSRLLAVREPLYRECADFVVDTEGKSADEVAGEIVSLIAGRAEN